MSNTSDERQQRRAQLSPEKRQLLAQRLQGRAPAGAARPLIPQRAVASPVPISYAQHQWFIDLEPLSSSAHHVSDASRMSGPFDLDALQRAFAEFVRRHEIMRTTFTMGEDGPLQHIGPVPEISLPLTDLSHLPAGEQEAAVQRWLAAQVEQPFDMERGPLWRLQVLRLAPEEHVLLLTLHHIICDGWSWSLLLSQLGALYEAFRNGRPVTLPEPRVQYADFAVWQRERVASGAFQAHLDFWRRQLGGPLPMLDLPADRPRPAGALERRWHSFLLPPDLSAQLEQLSHRANTTLFMTLLAAFNVLLYRYTGQTDLIVGTPVAARELPELEDLVGCFINTLVLRNDLSDRPTFSAYLQRVRTNTLAAYTHQDVPYELLLELIKPERVPDRNPIYQALFILQNLPMEEQQVSDVQVSSLAVQKWKTQFDISLDMVSTPRGLRSALEYSPELHDEATVERMVGHFTCLLRAICADPDRAVDDLPLLDASERAALEQVWSGPILPHPVERSYIELFAEQVARTPDALAAVWGDQRLTYAELDQRAGALAGRLAELGVGPEVVVGILSERGIPFLTAILAIFRAGGAYQPLDPAYPAQRHTRELELSRAPLVLVGGDFAATIDEAVVALPPGAAPRVFDLEALIADSAGATPPPPRAHPHSLAYVIFTSGSTGAPKGAMIEQCGMINHLFAKIGDLGMSADDRLSQNSPQCFDVSVWQFLAALLLGGSVWIANDETAHDPDNLLAWADRNAITLLEVVPALMRAMIERLEALGPQRPALAALRWLVPTGEALPTELCRRWFALYPHIPLLNTYGTTECSDDHCHYPLFPDSGLEHFPAIAPLGTTVGNMRTYVLDARMRPLPVGLRGELYVSGIAVGRGYLHDPIRTALAFVPDPFAHRPGTRMYRTGDLGRYRNDATIDALGRIDHQIKIRGFRIELGEIEDALRQHPAVRNAVVVARDDAAGQRFLAAYVVPLDQGQTTNDEGPGASPQAGEPTSVLVAQETTGADGSDFVLRHSSLVAELRTHLQARLPDYMVPAALMLLEELPLSPNGKIDRRALPAPVIDLADSGPAVAPRTPLEQLLAQLWSDLLGAPVRSVHDDFFQLGGHSLLAIQLLARLRDAFSHLIPLRTLVEHPTIAAFAEALTLVISAPSVPDLPLITPDPERMYEPFPLTDLQQGYWIGQTDMFALGQIVGRTYQEFELPPGALDMERLQQALERMVARHETLRMVIRPDGTQQVLREVPPLRVPQEDLRGQAEPERAARLAAVRTEMLDHGTTIDTWPLFDMRAFLMPGDRLRMHLSVPLILADGWSVHRFVDEFGAFYNDLEAQLPPLTLTYRDYVLAVHDLPSTAAYQRALAYWQARAAELPPAPQLPLQQSPSSLARPSFVRRTAHLPAETWRRLKQRAARFSLTDNSLLLAAYTEVLSTWSQQSHYTLNLLQAQRLPLHPEADLLLGNCSTTLLLEVDHRQPDTFVERARRLQSQLWADLEHRVVSGVRVLREQARLQGWSDQITMPVVFASMLHIGDEQPGEQAAPQSEPVFSHLQTPQVYLDHQVWVEPLTGELGYNWDAVERLFVPGVLDAMFAAYNRLLARLADDESLWRAADLGLTPQADLAARAARNAEALVAPPEELLYAPFFEQARRQPERTAVVNGARRISYGELAQRAWALGRELQARGATPESLVAVVLPKGWRQIVAVLAIQSAGAAYLPIDPQLPDDRRRHLLRHGEVRLAVTDAELWGWDWPEGIALLEVAEDAPAAPVEPPEPRARPDNLAYVIYTSGSTGLPKGVMITHRSARATIHDLNTRFAVGPDDRVLGLSSLSFDLSVYDVFGVLGAGGTLVLPGAGRDPQHWADLLVRERVTLWNSVPALLDLLLEALRADPDWFAPDLRLIMLSGDWIGLGLPERARARMPAARLISLGGATEAAIWSIWYPVTLVDPTWRSIPYGWPLSHQPWAVRNERGQDRPAWVAGELWIGGVGVAQGYWRDEERSAAQFVRDADGQRWYRTGDLGRYWPDGTLEIIGRVDFQVKIQGYRIELGEIEAALREAPAVEEAVVAVREDRPGEKRLVAYVLLADQRPTTNDQRPAADTDEGAGGGLAGDAGLSSFVLRHSSFVEELRARLQARLPAYMVPAAIVPLERLPLTANGKIDRRGLPAPEALDTQQAAEQAAPPSDALEVQIAGAWEQVLGLPVRDTSLDFFAVGGTSVSAVRLVVALREQLGCAIPLTAVFEASTVARQAAYIRGLAVLEAPVG